MHSVIARRDCDMPYPGCRVVRSSMALLRVLPVFGDCIVLRHMRRHIRGAKIGDMIGRIIRLVLTGRDTAASLLMALSMISEARRSAVPLACVTMPATAKPCRFDESGQPLLTNSGDVTYRVAGIDLTLSAPKSVSIIFALADDQMRRAIETAQQRACEATISFLDRNTAAHGLFFIKPCLARYRAKGPSSTPHLPVI